MSHRDSWSFNKVTAWSFQAAVAPAFKLLLEPEAFSEPTANVKSPEIRIEWWLWQSWFRWLDHACTEVGSGKFRGAVSTWKFQGCPVGVTSHVLRALPAWVNPSLADELTWSLSFESSNCTTGSPWLSDGPLLARAWPQGSRRLAQYSRGWQCIQWTHSALQPIMICKLFYSLNQIIE